MFKYTQQLWLASYNTHKISDLTPRDDRYKFSKVTSSCGVTRSNNLTGLNLRRNYFI